MTEQPLIEVRNLTKNFKDFEALKPPGVSLKIMPKEVMVIIGSSGSGKSTLRRCMNRLIEPTSGQVFFEGVEITDPEINIDDVRKNIGMVFQQFNLFMHLTVKDNIALPLRKSLKLPEDEIEDMVVNDKWLTSIHSSVKSEMEGISQKLACRIKELAERYGTPLPELSLEIEELTKKVDNHLEKMGFKW